jgi:hypothetical protein
MHIHVGIAKANRCAHAGLLDRRMAVHWRYAEAI